VTSSLVGAGRRSVSLSFRPFRGRSSSMRACAWQSPSRNNKIRRTTVGGRANIGLASFCSTPNCAKHDESRDFLNKPVMIEVEQTHKGARSAIHAADHPRLLARGDAAMVVDSNGDRSTRRPRTARRLRFGRCVRRFAAGGHSGLSEPTQRAKGSLYLAINCSKRETPAPRRKSQKLGPTPWTRLSRRNCDNVECQVLHDRQSRLAH
jgi:hypothetical protein